MIEKKVYLVADSRNRHPPYATFETNQDAEKYIEIYGMWHFTTIYEVDFITPKEEKPMTENHTSKTPFLKKGEIHYIYPTDSDDNCYVLECIDIITAKELKRLKELVGEDNVKRDLFCKMSHIKESLFK